MKTLFFISMCMSLSCVVFAEEPNLCVPPQPTVINQPIIWMKPNRDTPNWHISPPVSSTPPRTSSSVPSRGGS